MHRKTVRVSILGLAFLLVLNAVCLWPNQTARGASTITVPHDYSTIQAAINNAFDGDTIFVKAGTYYEHVVVNKTLSLVGENCTTTIVDGNWTGVVINVTRNGVIVSGLTVQRSGSIYWENAGILLSNVENCSVSENILTENSFAGLLLNYSHDCNISGNIITRNGEYGIRLSFSSNNAIYENNIEENSGNGIGVDSSSNYNSIFANNVAENIYYGIGLHFSTNNSFIGNNITGNYYSGIAFHYSPGSAVVANSIIENNFYGVWLDSSSDSSIIGNGIVGNMPTGVSVERYSDNTTISGNTIAEGRFGVIVNGSRYADICGNTIIHNYGTEEWDAGVRLDSASYTKIHDNEITDNWRGILLYASSPYVSIYGNNVTSNEYGIRVAMGGSNYVNISDNYVAGNRGYGIDVTGFGGGGESNYATIARNLIVNNTFEAVGLGIGSSYNTVAQNGMIGNGHAGVTLERYSKCNTILQNNIIGNAYGICFDLYIVNSTQNTIFNNNIVNNTHQVHIAPGSINAWNGNYPYGGNYWSDYNGTDQFRGSHQNVTGSDGIGDTPYVIDAANKDNYPLIDPWSQNAYDWVVDDDEPADFSTIQEAINAASNRDVIFVKAGTYYEHVVVNKTVSLLGEGVNMTIVDGSGTGNVFAITKDSVTIADFTVKNSGDILGNAGLRLDNVSLCSISGNGIRENFAGVWFEGSSENLITANDITSNVDDGVVFNYSHNNTISENNIALHEYFGIVINWSHNNTIRHNNVTQTHGPSHGDGINLWRSSNNNIFQNHVEENARYGMCIETQSNNNTLSDNVISNCVTGLRVYEFSNYNCIYGNRIANCSSGIELSNADLNKVFQNNITACEYGVKLDHTSNNVIQTNNITGNYVGVAAFYSTATCISDNFIAGNHAGVDNSWYTTCSIISRNYLTANNLSLHIYTSDSNTILKNNITDSGLWGVEMWYSRNNKFFHNKFADNAQHVNIFTPGYANFWDDGYPSGGNCWSDFFAWDIFSGPYQNETGSDGVGDVPYIIDENNVDFYPHVPYRLPADVNNDSYVGINDIFLIATNFGKEKGQPGWDPLYDIDSDYCVNVTDIFIAARHFGLSSDGPVRL